MNTRHTTRGISHDEDVKVPETIPALKLEGSRAERLRTLDEGIAHLRQLRGALIGEPVPHIPPGELHGRFINAPAWPWFVAGWVLGALFVLAFLLAGVFA